MSIALENTYTGSATGSPDDVSSPSVTATAGRTYLVATATGQFAAPITGISGMSLTWTKIDAQDAGRETNRVELWIGSGTATTGAVTATFEYAPGSAVITVLEFSGVDSINNFISANTNGDDGANSGGTDSGSYSTSLTTTVTDAVILVATSSRYTSHSPGSGYNEDDETTTGGGGNDATLAVSTQEFSSTGSQTVDGTFGESIDWSIAAVELLPAAGGSGGEFSATGASVSGGSAALAELPQAFSVQHFTALDVGNSGGTQAIAEVSSVDAAFVLINNNRRMSAGTTAGSGNYETNDLSLALALTDVDEVTAYRVSGSVSSSMRASFSVVEYVGDAGGPNEFVVRGRYALALNATTVSTTQAVSGVVDVERCVPFITGILSDATDDDADSGTAIAWMSGSGTLNLEKGANAHNVTVYVDVVEFIGSNWTVLHGDSGEVTGDTGSITLRDGADGTGTATDVSDWANALIVHTYRGDDSDEGTNDAIADTSAIYEPGGDDQTVDWAFHSDHDGTADRHFVHVIDNPEWAVTRYSDTASSGEPTEDTVDITSAGLTDLAAALVQVSSYSSGTGTAYARGWRNIYLNDLDEVATWCHRSGNTMAHRIQVVDLYGMDAGGAEAVELSATGAAASSGSAQLEVSRELAATGASGSGASASLEVSRELSASAAAASSGSASLEVSRSLSATGASLSGASSTLQVGRELSATGAAVSGASATLERLRAFSATGAGVSGGSADLDVGGAPVELSATGASVSSGSASLAIDRSLSATASTLSGVSAALEVARLFSSTDTSLSGGAAQLEVGRELAATGASVSTGAAALEVSRTLSATGASVSGGSASLQVADTLSATGASVSGGSASLAIARELSATGASASSSSATLAIDRQLAATGLAISGGSAAVEIERDLAATGATLSDGSAGLEVSRRLAATGSALSGGSAKLTVSDTLAATGTAISGGSASLQVVRELSATGASTSSSTSTDLAIDRSLSATSVSSSGASAVLVVEKALSATGASSSSGSAVLQVERLFSATSEALSDGSALLEVLKHLSATSTSISGGSAALSTVAADTAVLIEIELTGHLERSVTFSATIERSLALLASKPLDDEVLGALQTSLSTAGALLRSVDLNATK